VGIAEDVTEQLDAQLALRESEARKKAALNAALDAVVTVDEHERILEFNPPAERSFGRPAGKFLGHRISALIAPGAPKAALKAALGAALKRADDRQAPTVLEVVAVRADGSQFPIEIFLVPIPLAGQGLVTLFIRDLSQPRRVQEELQYVLRHARCLLRHFTIERQDGLYRWTPHDQDEAYAQEWMPLNLEPGCDYSESFTHRKMAGDAERNLRHSIEAMEAGLPYYTQEFRVRDLHGEVRWFSETISPRRRGEDLWDAVGVCLETTELKRGEEQLRQQVLQQTTLTELARQAAEGVELDLLLRQAAAQVVDLTGVELSSVFALEPEKSTFRFVAGKGWPERFSAWAESERLGADSAAWLAIRSGEPVLVPDLRTEQRFGYRPYLWAEGIVSYVQIAVQGSEGPWGALGCFSREPRRFSPEDVRFLQGVADVLPGAIQRDHAMALLRRSELRMEHLSSSSVIGVLEVTLDGRILAANKAFLDMLGLGEGGPDAPLPSWVDLTPEDYRAADESALRQIRATQVCGPLEKEFLHQDGHRVPVVATAAMLAEDNLAIALVMDLSPQGQLREQLHQAQKMEALGRLAGGIAHDFNNLLTVVNGYSDLLLQPLPPQDAARGKVEAIGLAKERAAALARQLLAFSRRQVVTPQRLDLRTTISGFDRILRRLIGEDVELSTLLCSDPLPILADPTQIEQTLLNLCVNARDAMPDGGRLTISADQRCLSAEDLKGHPDRHPGSYATLTVTDTGVGMTAEVMGRIFEPFYTTRGESGSGTGLGLAAVYGIVEQLNGFVSVESAPGQGAGFQVNLPLSAPAPDAQGDADRERSAPGGSETILLAEDDAMVRSFTRDLLSSWGYCVIEAGNGEEALRLSSQHEGPLHLLLSDLVMPTMGGRELVEQRSALRPETRTLLVSGYTDDQVVRRGVWARQLPFLQKPWAPADLARKIREVLGEPEEQP
jgi:PAS domain S-box-containing protein